jgi:hypothetical protein
VRRPAPLLGSSTLSPKRTFLAILAAGALLGLAYGCSASNDDGAGQSGSSGNGGLGEAGLDELQVGSDAMPDRDGAVHLNALCGTSTCGVPDDVLACADYVVAAVPSAKGQESEGGTGGQPRGDGAHASAAGEGGAGGSTGTGGEGQVFPAVFGCQVQRSPDPKLSAIAACAVVGPGGGNAPCLTSSDCQAGYGCVGDQSSGLCERYCCQDADACEANTYCTPRSLRDAAINTAGSEASSLMIPVCVPAENCDLSTPYPCASGTQCACKKDTACLVVRSDGTTTCAAPGAGKAGEACPCAWGHVCSAATNQCQKLCATRATASCGDGKCQSVEGLPDGWGICVGG